LSRHVDESLQLPGAEELQDWLDHGSVTASTIRATNPRLPKIGRSSTISAPRP
jgi:hypothetical protein